MTQKIIKQDVMNSLTNNINENNIDDLILELKLKCSLDFEIQVLKKNYMCFVAIINLSKLNIKNDGFGRSEYDALKTALINLIDQLLENEKFINPIRESLKIFYRNIKDFNSKKQLGKDEKIFKMKNDLLNYSAEERLSHNIIVKIEENLNSKDDVLGFTISKESFFNIMSNKQNNFNFEIIKENLKEKDLIILELEKMVIDMMNYNKKLIQILENESNIDSLPNYFKCPISWEKMESPVISMEGHSYEKWAIEKWLNTQQTSPITGLILNDNALVSNYTLKSAMDDYQKRQGKLKRHKIDLQKFVTKCEYDLNDLKKYFAR